MSPAEHLMSMGVSRLSKQRKIVQLDFNMPNPIVLKENKQPLELSGSSLFLSPC